MVPSNYEIVFSVSAKGFSLWESGGFGFAFIGIGIVLIVLDRLNIPFGQSFWRNNPLLSKLFNYAFLGIAVVTTGGLINEDYKEYRQFRDALCVSGKRA